MNDSPDSTGKEGPEAAENFRVAMKQILSVPKAEIDRREAEYKRQRLAAEAMKKSDHEK